MTYNRFNNYFITNYAKNRISLPYSGIFRIFLLVLAWNRACTKNMLQLSAFFHLLRIDCLVTKWMFHTNNAQWLNSASLCRSSRLLSRRDVFVCWFAIIADLRVAHVSVWLNQTVYDTIKLQQKFVLQYEIKLKSHYWRKKCKYVSVFEWFTNFSRKFQTLVIFFCDE